MHEITVAGELVRQIVGIMRREHVREIVSVSVSVGALSGVERGPLEFCFPVAAEGTVVNGARLRVHEVPVTWSCACCGGEWTPAEFDGRCARCGSSDVEIVRGRELTIDSLEVR
ncbi:MAG: hydrogenase maturation nickel metallochaperone HypA [Deltaproteobacteria bacterium]|nr:hydrogenase maturation nickel metallochaperone HypA [Deltaproteobacteria bacterium]